jgi:enamine deaminase RidA (YjgF/YER057c/UK114 family)
MAHPTSSSRCWERPDATARMAVGVSALPYDVAVEVEGVFEVR